MEWSVSLMDGKSNGFTILKLGIFSLDIRKNFMMRENNKKVGKAVVKQCSLYIWENQEVFGKK